MKLNQEISANQLDNARKIIDELDVSAVRGYASYPSVLEKAGAQDADMIIAATLSDEVNMVICQIAHSIFGIPCDIGAHWLHSFSGNKIAKYGLKIGNEFDRSFTFFRR